MVVKRDNYGILVSTSGTANQITVGVTDTGRQRLGKIM